MITVDDYKIYGRTDVSNSDIFMHKIKNHPLNTLSLDIKVDYYGLEKVYSFRTLYEGKGYEYAVSRAAINYMGGKEGVIEVVLRSLNDTIKNIN